MAKNTRSKRPKPDEETIFICLACPPGKRFETPFGNVINDHMIDKHTKTEQRKGTWVADHIKAMALLNDGKE